MMSAQVNFWSMASPMVSTSTTRLDACFVSRCVPSSSVEVWLCHEQGMLGCKSIARHSLLGRSGMLGSSKQLGSAAAVLAAVKC